MLESSLKVSNVVHQDEVPCELFIFFTAEQNYRHLLNDFVKRGLIQFWEFFAMILCPTSLRAVPSDSIRTDEKVYAVTAKSLL